MLLLSSFLSSPAVSMQPHCPERLWTPVAFPDMTVPLEKRRALPFSCGHRVKPHFLRKLEEGQWGVAKGGQPDRNMLIFATINPLFCDLVPALSRSM